MDVEIRPMALVAAIGVVGLAGAAAAASDGYGALDWFPLAAGASWRYEGTATVPTTGVYEMVDVPVALEMKVLEERRWGPAALFFMEGYPDDAAWVLEGATAESGVNINVSRYGLLCVANKVFKIDGRDCEEVTLALSRGGYVEEKFFAGGGPAFEFPLYEGARFGPYSQLPRGDGSYLWYCDGVEMHAGRAEYRLVFNTGPDVTRIWFVRGVGVVHYEYEHRGTPQRIQLDLKEFVPASS